MANVTAYISDMQSVSVIARGVINGTESVGYYLHRWCDLVHDPERGLTHMDTLISIKTLSKQTDISENTIRWWVATGKIPYVKLGKLVRFNPIKIQNLIDANTVGVNQ